MGSCPNPKRRPNRDHTPLALTAGDLSTPTHTAHIRGWFQAICALEATMHQTGVKRTVRILSGRSGRFVVRPSRCRTILAIWNQAASLSAPHNPKVAGSNPAPATKRILATQPNTQERLGECLAFLHVPRVFSRARSLVDVLFRFMMVIVVSVGVFQVRDAVPGAGRRCFGSCVTPVCSMLL